MPSNNTHNTQLPKSQSDFNATIPKNNTLGLYHLDPDQEKYIDDLVALLRSLGVDQFKPGKELTLGDITTFLLSTSPPPNIHPQQSAQHAKHELALIISTLENDPRFSKAMKEEFRRSNVKGLHPWVARKIDGEREHYSLKFTDVAVARGFYSTWVGVRHVMPRAETETGRVE